MKAFLKAGILTEDALLKDTDTGTPQGSILSPLLSNVALSGLDEYFAQAPGGPATPSWGRAKRRRNGLPNHRLVRFADDWTLLVAGTREDALALREQAARVLAPMGLALSEKTLITHIDEGVDFLGWRIQRHRKKGTDRSYVYTYPSKKALRAVMAKVKAMCRQVNTNHPLDVLLQRLNPLLRGWTAFFRPGVSSATFQFLDAYVWRRVAGWIRRKHRDQPEGLPPPLLRRRMVAQGPGHGAVPYRGGAHDPVPLPGIGDPLALATASGTTDRKTALRDLRRARCGNDSHGGFGSAVRGNGLVVRPAPRPGPTSQLVRCPGRCWGTPTGSTTRPSIMTGCCWG